MFLLYDNFVKVDFQKGSVLVKNCIFTCNATSAYRGESSTAPPVEEVSAEYAEDYYDAGGVNIASEPEGVSSQFMFISTKTINSF